MPTSGNEVQPEAEDGASKPEDLKTRRPEHLTLDALEQLREASLVLTEVEADSTEIRFQMLETLREYAEEQLKPEWAAGLRERHTDYFLALAEQADRHLQGPDQAQWLQRLDREHDNLHAALEACLEGRGGEGEQNR